MVGLRAASNVWASTRVLQILTVVLTVLFFPARVVLAQSSQQNALARTLFEEGVALADRGDYVRAADRFGRAHTLKPTSGIAFNWASVLLESGKIIQAQDLLLGVVRDPAADAQLKREAEQMLRSLAPRVSRLRVRVSGPVDDQTRVQVDGNDWPRAAWDIESPIDPGVHQLRLLHGDRELAQRQQALAEGESRDALLEVPQPAEALPPVALEPSVPEHVAPPPRPLYKHWAVWTAVGVVVAGGVVAGIVLATRKDPKDEAPVSGNTTPGVLTW
jgi:hypothetical protein